MFLIRFSNKKLSLVINHVELIQFRPVPFKSISLRKTEVKSSFTQFSSSHMKWLFLKCLRSDTISLEKATKKKMFKNFRTWIVLVLTHKNHLNHRHHKCDRRNVPFSDAYKGHLYQRISYHNIHKGDVLCGMNFCPQFVDGWRCLSCYKSVAPTEITEENIRKKLEKSKNPTYEKFSYLYMRHA